MNEISFIIFYSICILFIFICIYYISVSKNCFKNNIFYKLLGIFITGALTFSYLLLNKVTEYKSVKNKINKQFIGSNSHPLLEDFGISFSKETIENDIDTKFNELKKYITDINKSKLNQLDNKYSDNQYFAKFILNNHKQQIINDKYVSLKKYYNDAINLINEEITQKISKSGLFKRQLQNQNNTQIYNDKNTNIFKPYTDIKNQIDNNRIKNIFQPQMILIDINNRINIDYNTLNDSNKTIVEKETYVKNNIKIFNILSKTNLLPDDLINSLTDKIIYIGQLYKQYRDLENKKGKIPHFNPNNIIINELNYNINEDNFLNDLDENYMKINLKVQTLLKEYFVLLSEQNNIDNKINEYKQCYDCYDKIYEKLSKLVQELRESKIQSEELYNVLKEENNILQEQIKELQSKNQKNETNLLSRKETLSRLDKENQQLQEQLEKSTELNNGLTTEISTKDKQILDLTTELKSNSQLNQEEIERLTDSITKLTNEKNTLLQEKQQLTQDLSILQSKFTSKQQELDTLYSSIDSLKKEITDNIDKIQDLTGQLSLSESSNLALQKRIDNAKQLESQFKSYKEENEKQQLINKELKEQNVEQIKKLTEEYDSKYQLLETEYTKLKEDYDLN